MKSTFLLFSIFILSISCLSGCGGKSETAKPHIDVTVEKESDSSTEPVPREFVIPRRPRQESAKLTKNETEDWNTYKTNRINEDYSLMGVEASKTWLEENGPQYGIHIDISPVPPGTKYRVSFKRKVGTSNIEIQVANDDAGNKRVFIKEDS